jgi:putative transposase
MYDISKCAPQESLRNLEKAFKRFFDNCKTKKAGKLKGRLGYPKLKTKKKGIGSFRLTGSIHVFEKSIQLPKLGELKLKEANYIPTSDVHVLSATVSEKAGRWFVAVQVEQEVAAPVPATGRVLGVDLGIKTLATTSEAKAFENPKALRKNLAQAELNLSRSA